MVLLCPLRHIWRLGEEAILGGHTEDAKSQPLLDMRTFTSKLIAEKGQKRREPGRRVTVTNVCNCLGMKVDKELHYCKMNDLSRSALESLERSCSYSNFSMHDFNDLQSHSHISVAYSAVGALLFFVLCHRRSLFDSPDQLPSCAKAPNLDQELPFSFSYQWSSKTNCPALVTLYIRNCCPLEGYACGEAYSICWVSWSAPRFAYVTRVPIPAPLTIS